jgi:hypothetical protein
MYSWFTKANYDKNGLKVGKKVLDTMRKYLTKLKQEEGLACQVVKEA